MKTIHLGAPLAKVRLFLPRSWRLSPGVFRVGWWIVPGGCAARGPLALPATPAVLGCHSLTPSRAALTVPNKHWNI